MAAKVAGMGKFSLAIALCCSGCAMKHVEVRPAAVIVPNECIESIKKTPETWCEISGDGKLNCHGAAVSRFVGCEVVQIHKNEKRK